MRGAFAFAAPLGLVAALNPCAFPLLPSWLALLARSGAAEPTLAGAVRRALRCGATMTAAFVVVFCVAGALASAILGVALDVAPGLLLAVGILLIVGAVLEAVGHGLHLPSPGRIPPGLGVAAGFGAVYALASLGCTLPLFLGATGEAAAVGGWAAPFAAGLGYAVGMGLLVTAVGLVTACVGATAAHRLARAGRVVTPLGVALQALSGLGLAFVGLRDLGAPLPSWLVALQAGATSWLDRDAAAVCAVLGAVVLAGTAGVLATAVRAEDAR